MSLDQDSDFYSELDSTVVTPSRARASSLSRASDFTTDDDNQAVLHGSSLATQTSFDAYFLHASRPRPYILQHLLPARPTTLTRRVCSIPLEILLPAPLPLPLPLQHTIINVSDRAAIRGGDGNGASSRVHTALPPGTRRRFQPPLLRVWL
jgi:hypothetical protein